MGQLVRKQAPSIIAGVSGDDNKVTECNPRIDEGADVYEHSMPALHRHAQEKSRQRKLEHNRCTDVEYHIVGDVLE